MRRRQCNKWKGQGAEVVVVSVKLSGEVKHQAYAGKPSQTEVVEPWTGGENGLGKNLYHIKQQKHIKLWKCYEGGSIWVLSELRLGIQRLVGFSTGVRVCMISWWLQ